MGRLYGLLRNWMKGSEEDEEPRPAAATQPEGAEPGKAEKGVQSQPPVSYEPGNHFYKLILPAGMQPPPEDVVTFAAPEQPAEAIHFQEGPFAYTISVSETPRPEEDIISHAGDNPALEMPHFPSGQGSSWPGAMPNFSELIRSDAHIAFTYKTGDPLTDRLAEALMNPAFAEAARQETAKLHAGAPANL